MLTRRPLDRQLKLHVRKRLHHLWRKLWELAEINGFRYALS
ncbi:hypothetical protein CES85_4981 [Ochrobactrum quorumnocens]|uniref:Uncharacterized protein n=1 Tax=Ochrobactrum quorumnocens TaxID=271865 RepID=A0A248UCY2_9HYPH|nr:hypothetical protein CES85_4981 [[Ochrobactrum] quorumnocens]